MSMDFSTLAPGAPFYVLTRGERPSLAVGVVKERTAPQPRYQPQAVPAAFGGASAQSVVTVTATVGGRDETFPDIPVGVEVAQRGDMVFTGSREAMLQHVDGMMEASRKALDMVGYHKAVLSEGERMVETLNPRYAEEKRQARTIKALEERQVATDQKLSSLESQNAEILSILRQLNGGGADADVKR